MTRPRTLEVAGWTISLLELDALHAPLTWVFPHAAEDEVAWLPCHALLCRRGDEALLVDTGLGVFHDAYDVPVRLVALERGLADAGCTASDVTTVVLTHLDPDHAGGIVTGTYPDDLALALPTARVAMLDVVLREGADIGEHAERVLTGLHVAGARVDGIADGAEVVPGVLLRSAPGHRAGHSCVELSDGRERFVFLADAVHAREHVEHPEWDHLHDSDPTLALATRRGLIAELAGSGTAVACSHVDTFGTIAAGPRWVDVGSTSE